MALQLIGVNGRVPAGGGRIDPNALAANVQAANPTARQLAIQRGAEVNYKDKAEVAYGLQYASKQKNQVKLVQQAAKLGLIDKKKAADYVLAATTKAPVKPNLNLGEKIVKGAYDNIVAPVVNAGKDVASQVGKNVKAFTEPGSTQAERDAIIKNQKAAGSNKSYTEAVKSAGEPASATGRIEIQKKAAAGASTKELITMIAADKKAYDAQWKRGAGDLLTIVSTAVAPEAKAVLAGGKAGASTAAKFALAGAAGGEGASLQDGASGKEQLISTLVGAGLGTAIPVAGSLIGKGGAKAAAKIADSAVTNDVVKPYVGKIDQAVSAALKSSGKAGKNLIESLPGGKKVTGAVGAANDAFQQKLVTSLHPVYKIVRQAEAEGKLPQGTVQALDDLRFKRTGATREAMNYVNSNPELSSYFKEAASIAPKNKEAQQVASDYINAHEELNRIAAGKGTKFTPEQIQGFKDTIKQLEAKYGKEKLQSVRQKFLAASQKVDKLTEGAGLSKADLEHYMSTNSEYVRLQRERSEYQQTHQYGKGVGGNTNISKQKIKGTATQKALPANEVLLDKINHTFNFIRQQEFNKGIHQVLKQAGVPMKALKTTAKAMTRDEAKTFLRNSKPASQMVDRMLSKSKRELRSIQSELDKLNKQGLNESLKKASNRVEAPVLSGTRTKLKGAKVAKGGMQSMPTLTGTAAERQFSRSMTASETRDMVENLLAKDTKELRSIRSKIAKRDPKAAALLDEVAKLKNEAEAFHIARSGAYKEMLANKDLATNGAPVIKFIENGKENVYKLYGKEGERVADSLNGYNQVQIGTVAKIARAANNVFKYGTTQGNLAFALPNFIRDQMSSAINSESVLYTHNPVVFAKAAYAAVTKKDPHFEKYLKEMSDANYINVNKSLAKATEEVRQRFTEERGTAAAKMRANGPIALKDATKWAVDGYDSFINRLEFATRYQNYLGTKQFYKSKGYSEPAAEAAGQRAARRNSTDFSDAGDFGRVMNNVVPYLNAAVQGTRTVGRALRERPATTSFKLAMATTPVLALSYWNLSDSKRAALYADVPEYQRKSNFVVIIGNHKFLIPMAHEIQPFAGGVRSMIEAQYGYDKKALKSQAADFLGALAPVQANNALGYALGVLPPSFKAGIEAGFNKDSYTGQQIVPDYIKAQNPGNPTEQYYRDANGNPTGLSGTAKSIADRLGVSPLQVQHYLKNAFGTSTGVYGLNAIDSATGQDNSGQNVATGIAGRFNSKGGNIKSEFNNVYYPLSDSKNYKQKQINSLLYDGKIEQAKRVAEEWNKYVDQQFAPYYRQYGNYVDGQVDNSTDRVGGLKFDIRTSKKGRGYLAR